MPRRLRLCFAALALLLVGFAASAPAAEDLGGKAPAEIEALQRRLTDAACYAGPVDGQPSETLDKAIAACPSQDPQLRIETGMHVAVIWRIGVDAACSLAATGSDDKTVRLWALPDGKLLHTLRVPIGPGNDGKIFAVALSPDGRFVAAGGWDARYAQTRTHSVTIFSAADGRLVARVGAFENVIDHLAFSPDGRWLAATLGGGQGVRMIDTATWSEVAADKAYGADSYGAAFTPDGGLYTVAYDGKLRLYGPGPGFPKQREVATRGGKQPYSVAVDPGGRLLAVVFADSTKVDVYDAKTLAFRFAVDTKAVDNGTLNAIAWSADGSRLFAGGRYQAQSQGARKYPILTFGRDGKRRSAALPLADNTIMHLMPCGASLAVAAADPAFGLVAANGKVELWKTGVAPDMRDKLGDALTLAPDGTKVRFGLADAGGEPVLFDLDAGSLTDASDAVPGLTPARTEGLPVTQWEDRTDPRFGGTAVALDANETSRSLAIAPDAAGFVLGTEWSLRAFDAAGHERWRQPVPGVAWGVDIAADGRRLVAAYADGTMRWHRLSDGQELLALFVNRVTKAWVAWTPSGYYMASPGGEDLIGWHLNRGWDQAADFFPASRFREQFNRPDIVRLVLDTLDEAAAVKQANAAAKRRDDTQPLIERLPPVLTIQSPAEGSTISGDSVEIRYATRSPSGQPVDRIEAFVDGAKIAARGLARIEGASGSITLPMPPHDATISLVAYAGELAGEAVRLDLKRPAAAAPESEEVLKPKLYALLIGVTHYDKPGYDLGYPAADATGLAEALEAQKGKLYQDVEVKVLTDKEATTVGIKRGLSWLKKETTARDLAVVFAAGHGTTDAEGHFWFLSYDMDPDDIAATALSADEIAKPLYSLPGKKLLFLDACHSGAVLTAEGRGFARTDVSAAVNDFAQAEGGVVAYAASTGREISLERAEWGHGAFTKALLEGLAGKADLLHNGRITTATLDAFLEDRVKALTDGQQHPVMTRPKTVPDFPIALTP